MLQCGGVLLSVFVSGSSTRAIRRRNTVSLSLSKFCRTHQISFLFPRLSTLGFF